MKAKSTTPGSIILGMGLGGFFDGIVLHQIMGWHHLVCTTATCQAPTVEHLKLQNTQDGYFHLAMWILTVVGISMLVRALHRRDQQRSGLAIAGSSIAGWGIFNFVEGLINHQILGIHHVLPGHPDQFMFDMLFLASGLLFAGVGFAMVKRGRESNVAQDDFRGV